MNSKGVCVFIIFLFIFSDVNYLSTSAPPAASEWSSLLRPLRGREPEGMWNLLSIVREMFKRNDRNAIPLLEIITEEVMACEQVDFINLRKSGCFDLDRWLFIILLNCFTLIFQKNDRKFCKTLLKIRKPMFSAPILLLHISYSFKNIFRSLYGGIRRRHP